MHDYISGAGLAFEKLAEKLFGQTDLWEPGAAMSGVGKRSLNILGMTPLDFAAESCVSSLREIIEEEGWDVRSVWAMGDSLEELEKAGETAVIEEKIA